MAVFVVERYLAGWPVADVRDLVASVAAAATSMSALGVQHVQSVVIPGDETCLCVFDGPDADAVRQANERAGLPVDRVVAGEVLPAPR